MRTKICRAAAPCLAALALAGCSGLPGADIESLLRAPRLSGEASAVQKALNSYLGGVATLRYPATGDFLSPFLFGDWDGDGAEEAAVLYTAESSGANVWLAILEPDAGGWRVSRQVEGLSGEVESVNYAHLRDADSQQLLVGYDSAQGDRYMAVYLYTADETLQVVNQQAYTNMILADMTGSGDGTEDLVLALPTEAENEGISLQLLTYTGGDTFLAAQTLAVGEGTYSGCAGLQAGQGPGGVTWLVLDGWTGTGANGLVSSIILYDHESGFLKTYTPPGVADLYRATLRYDLHLLSTDLDGDGDIDIPTEITDGGELGASMENRLRFLLWRDYATAAGGNNIFGVYDSEYRFFLRLPDALHGNVQLRGNFEGDGWFVCDLAGTETYCELRLVDPAEEEEEAEAADGEPAYRRVANIGGRQLQARVIHETHGLRIEDIVSGVTVLR